jgi:putative adhesin
MRVRPSFPVLAMLLALAPLATAQDKERARDGRERDSYWSSILADFFMGPEKRDEFRWTGRIAPGATLEVKGINGRIAATPASGREIELVALKRGRRHDPKLVEIEFVEHAGGLTICAVYPSSDGGKNECKPGKAGRMHVRNNDVQVEFVLKLPANVSLVARTVNGSIEADGLGGNLEAYTVNGSVRLEARGYARAETVNGSIRATLGKVDWKEPLSFKTVNGSVRVSLPASANASVRVETVNGGIENEFSMSDIQKTRRSLSGTIGNGGRELQIKTVNGSVALRRAG